jgi:hypothetical protein
MNTRRSNPIRSAATGDISLKRKEAASREKRQCGGQKLLQVWANRIGKPELSTGSSDSRKSFESLYPHWKCECIRSQFSESLLGTGAFEFCYL